MNWFEDILVDMYNFGTNLLKKFIDFWNGEIETEDDEEE